MVSATVLKITLRSEGLRPNQESHDVDDVIVGVGDDIDAKSAIELILVFLSSETKRKK